MTNKFFTAIKCKECGFWSPVEVKQLGSSQFICLGCGNSDKIRDSNGWKNKHKLPEVDQDIDKLCEELNNE